jgi:hypothetical protein
MRYLRALLAFVRNQNYIPAPAWDEEDSKSLTHFLNTGSGKKLKVLLANASIRQNASAVQSCSDLQYRCGYASGFTGAIAALESFTIKPPIFETVEPDSSTDLDHLSP